MIQSQANPEEMAQLKALGLDSVEGAFDFTGGKVLHKARLGKRRRVRIDLTDAGGQSVQWYLKCYGHDPWWPRFKRWLTRQHNLSPARIEYQNILHVRDAGILTMRVLALGEETDTWGVRRSYIIVSSVPGESLERSMAGFLQKWGGDPATMETFNAALVGLVGRLHESGAIHRDLYAGHIFMEHESPARQGDAVASPVLRLWLIDLARAFQPRWRQFRWRVKDLSAVKYSMPAAWVQEHWDTFLTAYLDRMSPTEEQGLAGVLNMGCCGKEYGREQWARAIDRKVAWIKLRHTRKLRQQLKVGRE